MAIRIWHQSFTVLSDLPAYEEAMHLARVQRPDTEVVFHGQLPGTYPADYPGDDIAYSYLYGTDASGATISTAGQQEVGDVFVGGGGGGSAPSCIGGSTRSEPDL